MSHEFNNCSEKSEHDIFKAVGPFELSMSCLYFSNILQCKLYHFVVKTKNTFNHHFISTCGTMSNDVIIANVAPMECGLKRP